MGSALLFVHSSVRWLLLGALGWSLVRGIAAWRRPEAWTARDATAVRVTVGLADLQLVLGLVIYKWFSPWLAALRMDFAASMKNEVVRFFGAEHPGSMLVAIVGLHATSIWMRRAADDRTRGGRVALGFGLATLLIVAAIPWPFWWFGRPLLPHL